MEFKQDDSCSVQKSSCFLEIPFFKLSLTKGTLYKDIHYQIKGSMEKEEFEKILENLFFM